MEGRTKVDWLGACANKAATMITFLFSVIDFDNSGVVHLCVDLSYILRLDSLLLVQHTKRQAITRNNVTHCTDWYMQPRAPFTYMD